VSAQKLERAYQSGRVELVDCVAPLPRQQCARLQAGGFASVDGASDCFGSLTDSASNLRNSR
jgi:hypothetical protein